MKTANSYAEAIATGATDIIKESETSYRCYFDGEIVRYEPPENEQIIAQYTTAVQRRLDVFFQTRGYDGILSAATYATSSVLKFQAEGQYAVEARDATWAKCYEILAAVEDGTSPMPTEAELLAELPELVWPK